MEKNDAQISGFTVAKKAPSPSKKVFFKEKVLPAYLCSYDLKTEIFCK